MSDHKPADLDREMRRADGVMLVVLMLATAGALTMFGVAYLTSLF